jgi:coenzyme F420-reducing hydrogenase delta subunit
MKNINNALYEKIISDINETQRRADARRQELKNAFSELFLELERINYENSNLNDVDLFSRENDELHYIQDSFLNA